MPDTGSWGAFRKKRGWEERVPGLEATSLIQLTGDSNKIPAFSRTLLCVLRMQKFVAGLAEGMACTLAARPGSDGLDFSR